MTNEADGSIVITLGGAIDLATAPSVTEKVGAALAQGALTVIVDLRDVTFIDSSGLTTLVLALRAATEAGGSLVLRDLPGFAVDLLRLTGLDGVFQTAPGQDG